MVWCDSCYLKGTSDIFQVNDPVDEYGNLIYASRYMVEMDGAHLMGSFQCGLCVFCSLYNRNPRQV